MPKKTDTFDNYTPPRIRNNISEYILQAESYTETRKKEKGSKAGGWYSKINTDDNPQFKTKTFLVKKSGGYSLTNLNANDLLKITKELNTPANQSTLKNISQKEYLNYLYERVESIFVNADPKGIDIVKKMKFDAALTASSEKITTEFVDEFNQKFLGALTHSRDYMISYESLPPHKICEISAIKELYAFEIMRLLLGKDNVPPSRLMQVKNYNGGDSLVFASREITDFKSAELECNVTYLNLTGQIIAALIVGEGDFNFNNLGIAPLGESGEFKFYSIDHDYALNIDSSEYGFRKAMDFSAQSLSATSNIPMIFFSKQSIDRAMEHIASISTDDIRKLCHVFERKLDEYREQFPVDAYRLVGLAPNTIAKHIEDRHLQIKIISITSDLMNRDLEKFNEKLKAYQLPDIAVSTLLKLAEEEKLTDFVKSLEDHKTPQKTAGLAKGSIVTLFKPPTPRDAQVGHEKNKNRSGR